MKAPVTTHQPERGASFVLATFGVTISHSAAGGRSPTVEEEGGR
jgi:hypothetical protein